MHPKKNKKQHFGWVFNRIFGIIELCFPHLYWLLDISKHKNKPKIKWIPPLPSAEGCVSSVHLYITNKKRIPQTSFSCSANICGSLLFTYWPNTGHIINLFSSANLYTLGAQPAAHWHWLCDPWGGPSLQAIFCDLVLLPAKENIVQPDFSGKWFGLFYAILLFLCYPSFVMFFPPSYLFIIDLAERNIIRHITNF